MTLGCRAGCGIDTPAQFLIGLQMEKHERVETELGVSGASGGDLINVILLMVPY